MTCRIGNETKKKLLYINVGVYGILNAVEYSVILPTIWLYLSETYQSDTWYFGLCISGFHMSSLLFAPVFGFLNDRGFKTKSLVQFANLFQIIGSVLYLVRVEWVVFTARFVAGIGSAVGSLLYADVNRVTTADNRTPVIAILMLCRQIGLFVGPAFNLFLSLFHFLIGPVLVDRFTAPGFLMTILWIVFQFVMTVTYYNADELLSEEVDDSSEETDGEAEGQRRPFLSRPSDYGSNEDGNVEGVESPLLTPSSSPKSPSSPSQSPLPNKESLYQSLTHYVSEFSTESLVVLNTLFFICYFVQMSLETMVTPITERLFHYGEFENSLFFAIAGGVIFIACLAVSCISKVVGDRLLTLVGMILILFSVIWITVIVPWGEYGQKLLFFHFVGACFFDVVGLTIVNITAFSLYSKLVRKDSQGFGMGLRRAMTSAGLILGPLWAGSMLDNLLALYLVVLALLLMSLSMYALSYGKLKPAPVDASERAERA